jgi:hypothetical protein
MLRITIEKVPFGVEELTHAICVGEIWNDCSGTTERGSYQFKLYAKGKKWKSGKVTGFPRLKQNAWQLLALCLKEALSGG